MVLRRPRRSANGAGAVPIHEAPRHDGVLLYLTLCPPPRTRKRAGGGSNLDAHRDLIETADAHAVEFSKTAKPRRGASFWRRPIRPRARRRFWADRGV
jgi:hypothetical protein